MEDKFAVGGEEYSLEEIRVMRLLKNMGTDQDVKTIALRIIGEEAKEGTSKTNPVIKSFYARLSKMAKRGLIEKGQKHGTYKITKNGSWVLSQYDCGLDPKKAKEQDRKKAAYLSKTRRVQKLIAKRRKESKEAKKARRQKRKKLKRNKK